MGYDTIRDNIAGPLTSTPSIIHLSHQLASVPDRRVIQPAPLTKPFHSASPNAADHDDLSHGSVRFGL